MGAIQEFRVWERFKSLGSRLQGLGCGCGWVEKIQNWDVKSHANWIKCRRQTWGSYSLVRSEASVLLPLPLAPARARVVLASILRSRPSMTVTPGRDG